MKHRLRWLTGLAICGLGLLAISPWAHGQSAAAIPGYRLETVWPADRHGLAAPRGLAVGPDGRVWLLDPTAHSAVALTPDGAQAERRELPPSALDLAADPGGDVFVGFGEPNLGTVGRVGPGGALRWRRNCLCGTGSGVALTPGRAWFTDPKKRTLAWLGTADGSVSGQLLPKGVSDGFPSDVAAAPDGTLFATDLIGRKILAWPPPYLPNDFVVWDVLETNGPFRVGAGADADGKALAAVLLADGTIRVQRPDGSLVARFLVPGEPTDLGMGNGGRIYVLDDASREVRVYLPGTPPTATPPPPDPPLGRGSCRLTGERLLAPPDIARCGSTQVTLRLDASCPPGAVTGADVAVVIDYSTSMDVGRPVKKIDAARDAAKRLIQGLDYRYHRAAVVSFSEAARVESPLSADPTVLSAALDNFTLGYGTNYEAGIRQAMAHLTTAGRPGALPVIVLLTDGDPGLPLVPEPQVAGLVAAERARSRRAYIVTIGLGKTIDSRLMAAIASSPDDFYYAPEATDLARIYDTILRVIGRLGVTELVVADSPRAGFTEYVPGSAAPPPLLVNDSLTWHRPSIPVGGLVFTYTLRAAGAPGRGPAGRADVRYTDADGTRRSWSFPEPELRVTLPTGTPPTGPSPTPGPVEPTPPLPAVTAEPCPADGGWALAIRIYPDTVGAGGYACPGCNGLFDAGDHWLSNAGPVGAALVSVADGSGRVLWRDAVRTAGGGPMRAVVRLCSPPPYVVTLENVPSGYVPCPNSPSRRSVPAAAYATGRYAEARFGLWAACAPVGPSPTPLPTTAPLPACP